MGFHRTVSFKRPARFFLYYQDIYRFLAFIRMTNQQTCYRKKIIELLKDNSKYKTSKLAEMLDISKKTVSIKLRSLREKGIIERVGSDTRDIGIFICNFQGYRS